MTSPCFGCGDRCLGCHANCEKYLKYQQDLKAEASAKADAKKQNSILTERGFKHVYARTAQRFGR